MVEKVESAMKEDKSGDTLAERRAKVAELLLPGALAICRATKRLMDAQDEAAREFLNLDGKRK